MMNRTNIVRTYDDGFEVLIHEPLSKNAFNEAYMDYPQEYPSSITVHKFNPRDWSSYLENKMLDRIIKFMQAEHRKPTHIIMHPQDVRQLKSVSRDFGMGYTGFWKYKDMVIINSFDLVEGEIVCI